MTPGEAYAHIDAIIKELGPGLRLQVDDRTLRMLFAEGHVAVSSATLVECAKAFAKARGAIYFPDDSSETHEFVGAFVRAHGRGEMR